MVEIVAAVFTKKNYAMLECVSVEFGIQTLSNCIKKQIKAFTFLKSNETVVIIPK